MLQINEERLVFYVVECWINMPGNCQSLFAVVGGPVVVIVQWSTS